MRCKYGRIRKKAGEGDRDNANGGKEGRSREEGEGHYIDGEIRQGTSQGNRTIHRCFRLKHYPNKHKGTISPCVILP